MRRFVLLASFAGSRRRQVQICTLMAIVMTLAFGASSASAYRGLAPWRYVSGSPSPTATSAWSVGGVSDWNAPLWKRLRGGPADPKFRFEELGRPIMNAPEWEVSKANLSKARRVLGSMPKLRTLGTISLYAGAFQVGWKIGRTIDTQWLHLSGPMPQEDVTWTQLQWKYFAGLNGFVLEMQGSGLTNRSSVPWPSGGAVEANICTGSGSANWSSPSNCGSSWGTWRLYQIEQLAALAATTGATPQPSLQGTQALGGSANCGAGDPSGTNFNTCVSLWYSEDSLSQAIGADELPEPWVAQTTPNGNTTTNITLPANPPALGSADHETIQDFIAADASRASGAAGTDEEEETLDFSAGVAADPTWEGYSLPTFVVPDCTGLSPAACEALLDSAGHTGLRTYDPPLGLTSAVLTHSAGAIVETYPPASTSVGLNDEILFTTNPDPLPVEILEPLLGETYTAYLSRLQSSGYLGTVGVEVTVTELTEAQGVPALGPSAPVRIVLPAIESQPALTLAVGNPWQNPTPRVYPTTTITLFVNPPGYPPVASPPGGGSAPPASSPVTPPGVDFTPITDIDFGCKFPYGFICYAIGITELFDVTPDAPVFTFNLGTTTVGEEPYVVDLNVMDDYMSLWRSILSVCIWVGAVYILATRLLGFNAGGDPGAAMDDVL